MPRRAPRRLGRQYLRRRLLGRSGPVAAAVRRRWRSSLASPRQTPSSPGPSAGCRSHTAAGRYDRHHQDDVPDIEMTTGAAGPACRGLFETSNMTPSPRRAVCVPASSRSRSLHAAVLDALHVDDVDTLRGRPMAADGEHRARRGADHFLGDAPHHDVPTKPRPWVPITMRSIRARARSARSPLAGVPARRRTRGQGHRSTGARVFSSRLRTASRRRRRSATGISPRARACEPSPTYKNASCAPKLRASATA